MPTQSKRVSAAYLERGLIHFHAGLRGRAMRRSKVRDAVVRCALERSGNFRIQDLMRALVKRGVAAAHLVTVYRVMPLLLETGLVRELGVATAGSRSYEVVFERERKPRLLCRSCGRFVELESRTLAALERKIERLAGFELDVNASVLHGRCIRCQRAARRR